MTDEIIDEKQRRIEQWRERIAEQERSGVPVKQFCQEKGLTECSFYAWRKRLRQAGVVRFALVERKRPLGEQTADAPVELIVESGERLRIRSGVDVATLRTVLEALRR